jgi:hypothetical protein
MSIPPITGITGDEVLQSVHDFLGRFVSYPCEHSHLAHALWILHTHLMEKWDSTPRLAFLSPEPASGKTRALEITELLVPRPVCAVNVSPAYLFRKVGSEDGRPTILFDEVDTVFGPKAKDNEEVRGLLNAGHRRGAVAGRCVVHGKTVATEEIPAYSAVALAGLGWLPDTIYSRSVIIKMRRRKPGEKIDPFRARLHEPRGKEIRQTIEAWAAGCEIEWPDLPHQIQDRDADVWEPLIAVADAIGGEWPKLARKAAVALVTAAKEKEPSLGIRLLADIRVVFGDRDEMTTAIMLVMLNDMEEAPWGHLKGGPLNSRGLGKRLREYGLKSKNVRINDQVLKGYHRADFIDVWERYLPPIPPESATSATDFEDDGDDADFASENVVADDVADDGAVADRPLRVADTRAAVAAPVADILAQKPNKNGPCSAVADVADFPGNRRRTELPDIPPFLDRRRKGGGQPAISAGPDDDLADLLPRALR